MNEDIKWIALDKDGIILYEGYDRAKAHEVITGKGGVVMTKTHYLKTHKEASW